LRGIVSAVKEIHATGQPILIGTVTVEKSEELSKLLSREGIRHDVLNAKNHAREAEIVAQAGRLGAVTIATNMAGRGTDIMLGGNPEFLAKQEMAKQGYTDEEINLSTSFVEGGEEQKKLQEVYRAIYAEFKKKTDEEKAKVMQVGGLYILGTERHDSRRIDNQLRGRSGRQGEPGESCFFISIDDEMFRIYGDRIQMFRKMFAWGDDQPIQMKMISRQVESSQKIIEGRHFRARKYVLQYDDVNNTQRKMIYKERNKVLDGEDVHEDILGMVPDYARRALETACGGTEDVSAWDFDAVNNALLRFVPLQEGEKLLDATKIKNARAAHAVIVEKVQAMLNEKYNTPPQEKDDVPFDQVEKYILLRAVDALWMQHIENLEQLRQGVGLQAIGQHDPVVVYKKEAFDMFEKLNEEIDYQTVYGLLFSKVKRVVRPTVSVQKADLNPNKSLNRPCPCGSGKKYKDCCFEKDDPVAFAKRKAEIENRNKKK